MTTCPFCNRDPFHYVDIGVGHEAAAVECCEFGDLYFRGARPALTKCVIVEPDEFVEIGNRIQSMKAELDAYREKYGDIFTDQPT